MRALCIVLYKHTRDMQILLERILHHNLKRMAMCENTTPVNEEESTLF